MAALIEVESISYRYPGADGSGEDALHGLSLQIGTGEFVAVLGSNGSGKTTLARHLNGLLLPDRGRVLVEGLDTRERSQLGKIRQKVGMVFQHPDDQIVASTVEEDVAFGPENLGIEAARIRRRVDEAIAAVGLDAHRQRPPHLLSAGQMQRLALAGVLAMRPKCVVFDEATTMLDPAGRRMALELMDRLRAEGLTVIFITHNMEEAALAERVIVMHAGQLVFDGPPAAAFAHPDLGQWGLEPPPALALARQLRECLPGLHLAGLGMDDLLAALPPFPGGRLQTVGQPDLAFEPAGGNVVVEVSGLEHTYLLGTPLAHLALDGVDLRVLEGRAHGLAGSTGSGKSTLLQHLNGILRPQKGSVRVGDLRLEDPTIPVREVVRLAGLVFQNPEAQFFETYAGDEVAFGPRQLGLPGSLRERVRDAMEQMGLDFERFKDRPVFGLSGGERRKVALASVIANAPKYLLLDEPTAGLDPIAHREILARLRQLQTEGVELIVSSHQMDDLAELVQDLTIFRKGRCVMTGLAGSLFGQDQVLTEAGLEPSSAAMTAERLRALGWTLPSGLVTPSQLEAALKESCGGAA